MNNNHSNIYSNGKSEIWYKNLLGFSLLVIVFFHSLFPYSLSNLNFYYSLRSPESFSVDFLMWAMWALTTPLLFYIMGRGAAEVIKKNGLPSFINSSIKRYSALIFFAYIVNLILWYVLCKIFSNQLQIVGLSFWAKPHHLWFFIYLLLCRTILCLSFRFREFIEPALSKIKFIYSKYPDTVSTIGQASILIFSAHGFYIGNPAGYLGILPAAFIYFLFSFLIGVISYETEDLGTFEPINQRRMILVVIFGLMYFVLVNRLGVGSERSDWFFYLSAFVTAASSVNLYKILVKLHYCKLNTASTVYSFVYNSSVFVFCFNFPIIFLIQNLLHDIKLNFVYKIIIINISFWGIVFITQKIRNLLLNLRILRSKRASSLEMK